MPARHRLTDISSVTSRLALEDGEHRRCILHDVTGLELTQCRQPTLQRPRIYCASRHFRHRRPRATGNRVGLDSDQAIVGLLDVLAEQGHLRQQFRGLLLPHLYWHWRQRLIAYLRHYRRATCACHENHDPTKNRAFHMCSQPYCCALAYSAVFRTRNGCSPGSCLASSTRAASCATRAATRSPAFSSAAPRRSSVSPCSIAEVPPAAWRAARSRSSIKASAWRPACSRKSAR